MPTTEPFAKNGVSLRLYPHNELDAAGVIDEICAQAKLGLGHGFDGIMTSEHHGGFGGYFGNPLQLTTFFLEENPNGWAAPCPLLLPLRPTLKLPTFYETFDRPGDQSLCGFCFAVAVCSGVDEILQVCLHLRIGADG